MHRRLTRYRRAALPAVALIAFAMAPSCAAASPRAWQALILTGAQIPQLGGAPLSHIEVVAIHDGSLAPVPFQIDERLPDGSYALPSGIAPIADDSPDRLDADDEIALMVSDLGERVADPARLAPHAIEIAATDPLGGPARYAYLAATEHPRLSAVSYMAYDANTGTIESDAYRIGFTRGLPTDFALQAGRGGGAPSMIDRIKLRVSARVLKLFPFRLDEDDVENDLRAWRAGPIRVIKQVAHSVRLILGIRSPGIVSHNVFYRDYISNPFDVHFPWMPRLLFGDIEVRLDVDFTDLAGFAITWNGLGRSIPLGASDSARLPDSLAPPPEAEWIAYRGRGRTLIQTIAGSDMSALHRRLYLRDDAARDDAPERVRGEHPGVGFTITGWEELSRGEHRLASMLVVAPGDYDPAAMFKELENPLAITAAPVSR